MAYTIQTIVDMARKPLNDDDKVRASDATCLGYAIAALHLGINKRPDLFFGQFSALPDISALALTSNFPVDDMIAPAIADYITARVESGNDEAVLTERATMFFNLFKGGL